ncbi:DUF2927 domain-containing protein [Oceanibium sediminis]|uniref:DUF2927 domain-containing protein n=1 Tax=Oceanibium sediminis TaxID=2026339 RepID=UPI000DD44F70|nr:DUF2927 domain-containing protein [Oceanibium sediminis]
MTWKAPLTAICLFALAACETASPIETTRAIDTVSNVSDVSFPVEIRARGVPRSNIALAEDFLDLTFALERGEPLRGLLRHEAPVRVYIRPGGLRAYSRDVENLLSRFRAEAGIDIRTTTDPAQAQIHVDGVSLRELQRVDSGAACFIVPGETNWEGFRARSARARLRWSAQTTLGTTAIFIPTDTFPQDIRDCLHEELAQALGPANDLYRLPDSVFNDDNFHSIVTSFDMLMLRALYDPELRSGMPRQVVAGKIVQILDRINPGGSGRGDLPRAPASAAWKSQIETALTRRNADRRRLAAANRAVDIARAMQPNDHRLGVALITRGRLNRARDPESAAADFIEAHELFRARLGRNDVRTAQAALHVALVALETRDYATAGQFADSALGAARDGQNAVLLSSLLAVKAAAMAAQGERAGARASQLDHLRWARYAYGDGNGERRRAQAELEALTPRL